MVGLIEMISNWVTWSAVVNGCLMVVDSKSELPKVHWLPEVIKTVLECRNIIDKASQIKRQLTLPYNIIFYTNFDQ